MTYFQKIICIGFPLAAMIFIPGMHLGFVLPKIVVLQTFLLFGLISLRRKKVDFSPLWKTWVGRFAMSYFVVFVLATIFSITPEVSLFGASPELQGLTTQILFFIAFLFALAQGESLKRPILWANIAVVLYGLLQIFNLDPFASMYETEKLLGRTYSTLGNPNFLASFLLLTMPFLFFIKKKRWQWFFILMNFIVFVSTASQGAIISLLVVGIGALAANRSKVKKVLQDKKTKTIILLATFIVGTFTVYSFQKRFAISPELGRSWNARLILWQDTAKLIRERPQGFGLETLSLVYPKVLNPKLFEYENITTSIDRAHNVILDLWVTASALAPVIFILFLLAILRKTWSNHKSQEGTQVMKWGIIAYFLSLLVSFETILTGFFFWTIAGMMLAQTPANLAPKISQKISKVIFGIAAVALIMLLSWNIRFFLADFEYSEGEKFLARNNTTQALIHYAKALEYWDKDRIHLLKATEVALIALEEDSTDKKIVGNFIQDNLETLEKMTKGLDASTLLLNAWYQAQKGESFEETLEKAKALAPNQVMTYKIAGHIYEQRGDKERAQKEYREILPLLPSYLNDPESEKTRIFWKQNIWLKKLLRGRVPMVE